MYPQYGDNRASMQYSDMQSEIPYMVIGQDYQGGFENNTASYDPYGASAYNSQPSQYSYGPGMPNDPSLGYSTGTGYEMAGPGGGSSMRLPVDDWRAKWVGFVPEFQDVPRGLQYLIETDTLIIEKVQEENIGDINSEIILPYQYRSAFNVFDKKGYQLYYAFEESASCIECCSQRRRTFTINLTNRTGENLCTFTRHCRIGAGLCLCCLCPCCWDKMSVAHIDTVTKTKTPLGKITESWSPIRRYYKIYDVDYEERFRLKGHCNCLGCCASYKDYDIVAGDVIVGKINKEFIGLHGNKVAVDQNVKPRQFGCNFSASETVDGKVLLMAAAFLVNCMWYEEAKPKGLTPEDLERNETPMPQSSPPAIPTQMNPSQTNPNQMSMSMSPNQMSMSPNQMSMSQNRMSMQQQYQY